MYMGESSVDELPMRVHPVQLRGRRRVDAVLDAAASVLDAVGLAGLNTTDVARAAETSVGSVYRYFPNAEALLRALVERNLSRFWEFLSLVELDADDADDYVDVFIRGYLRFAATEPGFKSVHFGHLVEAYHGLDGVEGAPTSERLVDGVVEYLAAGHELEPTPRMRTDIEVAVTAMTAVLQRSLSPQHAGQDGELERSVAVAHEMFGEYRSAGAVGRRRG